MRNLFRNEALSVDLVLVRPSDKAWLVRDRNGTEEWLPISQVDFPSDSRVGATVTVDVPLWLAEDKGLE